MERHLPGNRYQVDDITLSITANTGAPRERGFLGAQIFKENMVLCPSRVLFLIACFLIMVMSQQSS